MAGSYETSAAGIDNGLFSTYKIVHFAEKSNGCLIILLKRHDIHIPGRGCVVCTIYPPQGAGMRKSPSLWQMAGFIFTSIAGTLLHFLYELSGEMLLAAPFAAVNESIWEHMKLLYFPMLVYALIEYFVWGKHAEAFWCVKLLGIVLGLILIPVLYYTYTGALGINADWFNIAIFFFAAGLTFWVEAQLFRREWYCPISARAAVLLLVLIGGAFAVWTFCPPQLPLFRDPLTGSYGIEDGVSIIPAR